MNIPAYCFWALVFAAPGFALCRLFLFITGGWKDLLSRVITANLFAGTSAAFLAASFYGAGQTMESVSIFSAYLAIQTAWLWLDIVRFRLLPALRRRLSIWYAIVIPPSKQTNTAEPAE